MTYKFLIIFIFINSSIQAAGIWQWSIQVQHARNAAARAFLWIPTHCKKVRAVVVAQNNMEELSIVENAYFRQSMADLSFAIVWVSPAFDHLFRFNEGAGECFTEMMNALADSAGYTEIRTAPIIPMGHSAAASWPYYFAAWNPGRTLCAISISGQWPYFRDQKFAPDIWGNKNIDFVPCLETMGEYEAANTWSEEGLKERKEHPFMPLSMLACPAEGHFAATDSKIKFIAFYISKAAQYRLPNKSSNEKSYELIPIDPTKTGWLADKWRLNEKPVSKPAAVKKYKGDTAHAFWFFDEETAKRVEQYQASYRSMKAQLLGYIQNDGLVSQRNTHLQVEMSFLPNDDGISFTLKGAFLKTVPGESERPAAWTGLSVGTAIGHAKGKQAVRISRVTGPFVQLNDTSFQLAMQKDALYNHQNMVLTFCATHPGDLLYKPAVQQAEMIVPASNTNGIAQHIVFSKIVNQPLRARVRLKAHSDAHLPVRFYIREGPAFIKNNLLIITAMPPRSKFPVTITVVAWQYGKSSKPAVQSAVPVEQTFYVIK